MKYFINLSECAQSDVKLVGGKAKNLGILISEGVKVPSGYCLTTTAYCSIKKIDELIEEYLVRSMKNDPSGIKILSHIRKIILSYEFPKDMQQELFAIWEKQNQIGKIVVRSSAVGEDSVDKSYAGIYKSYLNIDNYEDFLLAIRNVWCSIFSEVAMYYQNKMNIKELPQMAMIIQKMEGEYASGVLFSHNPQKSFANSMIVEGAYSAGEIVRGKEPNFTFNIAKEDSTCTTSENLSQNVVRQLKNTALKIERIFDGPVDIEWASNQNEIYILQARPLSIESKMKDDIPSYDLIPLDDIEKCEKLDLEYHGFRQSYIKWLNKKYWIRLHAKEAGIECYGEYFLKFTRENANEAYKLLLKNAKNSSLFIVRGHNLEKKYYSLLEMQPLLHTIASSHDNERDFIIQLGEFIPVELAGFSTLLDNGNCLIEYCPGLMTGIMSGEIAPSLIIVDDQLNIMYEDKKLFDVIYIFDENLLEKKIVKNNTQNDQVLDEKLLRQIVNMTQYFSTVFSEPRIEWYFYNNKLFIKDLSMEENKMTGISHDGKIMSEGYAEGEVVYISNTELEYLDEISEKMNLSVISRTDEQDNLQILGNKFRGLVKIERLEGQKIIVLTNRPSTGFIPYLSKIKGFIFNQGSLLCHLGIVLREEKIPAQICKNATDLFSNGDKIRITSNGIIKGI